MEKILMVDDDVELCELVARYLVREGFEVEAIHDGAQGAERALDPSHNYALMVLDVMLPGLGGLDVLRRVRSQSRLPVLMLTARGEETDRIVGLEIGADDYLPKPFNPRELTARIRAVLRRAASLPAPPETSNALRVGDVEIEPEARRVRRGGTSIEVTGAEFDLLVVLCKNAGTIVSRRDLVRIVLNRPLTAYDRSIDTMVSNLRRKLGPSPDDLELIKAVRGIGYIFVKF